MPTDIYTEFLAVVDALNDSHRRLPGRPQDLADLAFLEGKNDG